MNSSTDTATVAPSTTPVARPAALWWRLLAMLYDAFPLGALVFATAAVNLLLRGGEPVQPDSLGARIEFLAMLLVGFVYFGLSWRRGGQTLGMRAWRLRVLAADGSVPGWRALWIRYVVAIVSLALGGLGYWWSLFDRERRTWHDLASRTLLLRTPKPAKRPKQER